MADYKINADTSVKVYSLIKDECGVIIPLASTYLFTVTLKTPYGNLTTGPLSVGITGPIVSYGSISGPSQFFFTTIGTMLGDWKYKIQYDSTGNTGSYGPAIKAATVGSFRVVDDDF